MRPVQGMKLWRRLGRLPVLPPPPRNKKGKPHDHARKKAPHESSSNPYKLTRHGRVGTCSNCKKEGHNKTRCPDPSVPPPPKRPRGRPKKNQGESSQGGASQGGDSQAGSSQVGASQSSQGRFGFSS
ncbi:unnamed protein product [Microthlaspi erraticum]|uniref:CCHC-type domain-containing protein n=1 Tax=Microthlaspi erraticum TaxID=1685480 RepID=A0A6D2K7J7_9BRAS|nr:unnamed protein product [Microthlaspi erraticum]CAA7048840.1 unnamed protein product [Microthlaspi erraticum]CAA7052027.1 unnamed protein product [Microthlaspi erraticum]